MQARAQRVGGEQRLPPPGRQLGDACSGMLADPLQHVDEVRVRVDALQAASCDQALHDARVFGANFGPAEEPVFSACGYRAQGALDVVRVDGHLGVALEKLSAPPDARGCRPTPSSTGCSVASLVKVFRFFPKVRVHFCQNSFLNYSVFSECNFHII